MIYVEPESGLGNRFRVIDSAIQLAKYRKTKIELIWKVNHDVGAPFLDLFEPFDKSTNIIKITDDFKSGYYDIGYNRYFKGFKRLSKPALIEIEDWDKTWVWKKYAYIQNNLATGYNYYDHSFEGEVQKFWNQEWPSKNYYIRTYSRFFGNVRSDYSMFKPRREILDICSMIFSDYTVGVHIRRSDSLDAINASPTEKYIKHMLGEIEKNKDVRFFLATDSEEERNQMITLFKDRIIYHPSALERSSSQGIKDAMIELTCLSTTNKIIGSSCSSFTEAAISYNGIKDHIIVS